MRKGKHNNQQSLAIDPLHLQLLVLEVRQCDRERRKQKRKERERRRRKAKKKSRMVPSPACPHCSRSEAIIHVLLQCRQYAQARDRLIDGLGHKPPDDEIIEICLERTFDKTKKGRRQTRDERISGQFLLDLEPLRLVCLSVSDCPASCLSVSVTVPSAPCSRAIMHARTIRTDRSVGQKQTEEDG